MLQTAVVRLGVSVRTPGPSLFAVSRASRTAPPTLVARRLTTSSIAYNDDRSSSSSSSPSSSDSSSSTGGNGTTTSDDVKPIPTEATPAPAPAPAAKETSSEGVPAVGAGFSRALLFPTPGLNPSSSSSTTTSEEPRPPSDARNRPTDRQDRPHRFPSSRPPSSSSSFPSNRDDHTPRHRPHEVVESTRVILTNLPITATPWDLHRLAVQNRQRLQNLGARMRSIKEERDTLSGSNGILNIKRIYTRHWRPTRTAVLTFDKPSRAQAYVDHVQGLDRASDSRDVIGARIARPTSYVPADLPPTHALLHYLLLPKPLTRPRSSTSNIVLLRGLPYNMTETRVQTILSRHYRLDLSSDWPKPRRTVPPNQIPPDMPTILKEQEPRPVIRLEDPFGPSQVTSTFIVRLETDADAARLVRNWDRMIWDQDKRGGAKGRERREGQSVALRTAIQQGGHGVGEMGGKRSEVDEREWREVSMPAGTLGGELDSSDDNETWIVEAQMMYPG